MSAATFSESTLMIRENLIKVTINLIKPTPFIIFGENGNDTTGMILFDIQLDLLFMDEHNVSFFQL